MRPLGLVQGSTLGHGGQRQRRIRGSDLTLGVSGHESPAGSLGRVGCQRCRAFQEGGRRRHASSRSRPDGGTLKVGSDLFVGQTGRLGSVPGPAIRIDLGIGSLRQGTVDVGLLARTRMLDRRPSEPEDVGTTPRLRMSTTSPPRPDAGRPRRFQESERPATPGPDRRPGLPTPRATASEHPPVALRADERSSLGSARTRAAPAGKPNPPASCAGVEAVRQLQQSERIPVCLGDNPPEHSLVNPHRQD